MQPPGMPHRWWGILLLTAFAISIGLAYTVDAPTQAAGPTVGEVLPMQPPKQPPSPNSTTARCHRRRASR